MSDYHEPYDLLDANVRDIHRALVSMKEEIEAIDWYSQRIAVCSDPELKAVDELIASGVVPRAA